MRKLAWCICCLVWFLLSTPVARSQEQRFSLAMQGVSLSQALEQFVNVTGLAVSYDPVLVAGHLTYCAADNEPAEVVLRCLLRESGLDFYRLSSGTYILASAPEITPQPGYVTGTVVDRETGHPLTYAHVLLDQADLGSVTNQSGQFIFSPVLPGRYVLSISHVGYETWHDTLRVYANYRTVTEASLQAKPVVFAPIIVDGLQQRLPSEALVHYVIESANGVAGSSSILAGNTLGSHRPLPGIRINNITADINIQGGEAGDHQLQLDDVPIYLPRTMMGFLGPFGAFSVDQITIHKAGFGASYGSQTGGVIAFQHAIGTGNHFDAQIDPFSVNTRIQYEPPSSGMAVISMMGAARVGLWNVYRPSRLAATLNEWSAPDPFLLGAPLTQEENLLVPFSEALSLKSTPDPELHFSDVHGAVHIRVAPMHTVRASFYAGGRRLGGSLLPDKTFGRNTLDVDEAFLTVVDDYDWSNRLGQIRYQAVLGGHSVFSTQFSGSTYRLDDSYVVLDSLTFGTTEPVSNVFERTVKDSNDINTVSLKTSIDHARGAHQLRFGAEAIHSQSRFDLQSVVFQDSGDESGPVFTENVEFTASYDAQHEGVRHSVNTWRYVTFTEDEITIRRNTMLNAGVRLTYVPDRITVYAEPRLSLRHDHENGWLGPWSTHTAVGIYRQYLNQLDVSKISTGTLLPSVRIWLPTDQSVRPPIAFHFTQAVLFSPVPGWQFRLEGYYKYQPHGLVTRYAEEYTTYVRGPVKNQTEFLASVNGRAYGGTALLAWEGRKGQARFVYEYSNATRKSPELFEGRRVPVPWNEPHRINVVLDWRPLSFISLSARWSGIWGRSWAFRRAYYDYFGQSDETRYQTNYDLGRPDDHVLPPFSQLDLNLTYTQPVGSARLQVQVDILNALDRRNEADWRIVSESDSAPIAPRYFFPRLTALAVRLSY